MTRTDTHRPSVIVPADYDFVACECVKIEGIGDCYFIQENRRRITKHMTRTGGTYSGHDHGGNCHICGSVNLIYSLLFHHRPSNTYIRCGEDCADKLEFDSGEGETFRRQVRDAREAVAGKRKAQAILSDAGLSKAWDFFTASSEGREESIIRDIVGKLVQYGSLSDKQLSFLRKLVNDIATRAEREAARAAEQAAAKPVPVNGTRIAIEGTILSVRTPDYNRGECGPVRMLVQHADGWKVWGSVPAGLMGGDDVLKGQRVRFSATVKKSDRDEKFGFFSRPTKAELLREAV